MRNRKAAAGTHRYTDIQSHTQIHIHNTHV